MLINEVSKKCNLTKKAVEYYSEQKLVCPTILENGYRDFSNEDVENLKQIALYRQLGLSIFEIKSILANPNALRNILYKKSLELEQEKIKQDILQKLCDGENLKSLEEEINSINSKSIIIKKLLGLFPSYYGKFISLNYSNYLTGKIETKEQMEAFYEIIDFLDNAPNIEIPEDLQEYLDEYLDKYSSAIGIDEINKIIEANQKSIKNIDKFVEDNRKVLEKYKEYKETDEFKNSPANRLMELMKEFCSTNGYYDKFIPAMRRLSPSYNEHYEQMLKANEQFIKNHSEFL